MAVQDEEQGVVGVARPLLVVVVAAVWLGFVLGASAALAILAILSTLAGDWFHPHGVG